MEDEQQVVLLVFHEQFELMLQMIMTNLPVDFIGAVLGAVLAGYFSNSLVALSLSFCGIRKSDMDIRLGWLFLTVIGILFIAFTVSLLCSIKIRKIEPVKLLEE